MRHTWQQTAEEATVDDDEDVSEDEDPLELSTLQHSDARWKTIKKGDKVFWCYRDEDWGWIVLPPRTVVDLREHGASLLAGVEGRYWDHYRSIYRDQFLEALELKPNTALKSFEADDPHSVSCSQTGTEWRVLNSSQSILHHCLLVFETGQIGWTNRNYYRAGLWT